MSSILHALQTKTGSKSIPNRVARLVVVVSGPEPGRTKGKAAADTIRISNGACVGIMDNGSVRSINGENLLEKIAYIYVLGLEASTTWVWQRRPTPINA
jgi:hypothetical protein